MSGLLNNSNNFSNSNGFHPIVFVNANAGNTSNPRDNSSFFSEPTSVALADLIVPISDALLYVFAIVLCSIFIQLLYQVRPFHQNLSILLGNMAVSFLVLGVMNNCLSLHNYVKVDFPNVVCFLLNTGWYDALFIISFTPFMIAIERAVATYKAKTYETTNSAKFGICLVVVQWGFAIGMSAVHQIFDTVVHTDCNCIGAIDGAVMLIALYVMVTCNLVGIPAVITLMRINKKQYATTFRKQSHCLSERYQLAENIKTTRFIMPITAINSVCALFGVILALVAYSLENPPVIVYFMMNLVFYSLLPCYGILYPLVSAYAHPALRKQIKRKYLFCWKSAVVSPAISELRNPIGKSLIIDSEKEADLYFAGLQSAWN